MAASDGNGTGRMEVVPPQTLETSVGTLEYREYGAGPPVVFVHGFLTDGTLWRDVVPRVAAEARAIVVEWPMGSHRRPLRADADLTPPAFARLIAEVLERLELEDVTLVGNDSGGAMCQLVVTAHPERIGALLLTSCDAFDNFFPPAFRFLAALAKSERALGAAFAPLRTDAARRLPLAFGWLSARRLPAELTAGWVRPVLDEPGVLRDAAKLLRGVDTRYTEQAARDLGRFDRPAVVLWSAEDRFFPVAHGRRLADLLPRGRFELIEGARTYSPVDAPERVAGCVAGLVPEAVPR